jgi:hypothetical protein
LRGIVARSDVEISSGDISVAGNCLAGIDEVGIICSMPALYTNLSDVSRVFFIYFSGTGLNEYLPIFGLILLIFL